MNLCNNAAHAMREKGGTLEIGLSETVLKAGTDLPFPDVKPGAYILLSLKDSGQGIPTEIMPRIFEPFFTTKNKGEGTGMGLAMVHGIVKSHGGAITVASDVGKGSEFTVYLPRVSGKVAEARESRAPLPKGTERILFVDDEDMQVRAMTKLLEHLGYRVQCFTDAAEALEAFRTEPGAFDLAIMDQTMPRLSGGELARELLRIKPGLPIILCSGYSETLDEGQALAMGIRAFIMKPFSAMEIAQSIRRVLAAAS
jgi:CheY-like chemotaxis protein